MNFRSFLFAAAALAALSACGGGGGVGPINGPVATPTPPQNLYVGSDHNPGVINQVTLPLTSSSASNFSIASNNVVAVAPYPGGGLAVADNAGNVTLFAAPLSASSLPSAQFKNGVSTNDGQIAVSAAGDLYIPGADTRVNIFTHPITSASTPSSTLTVAPGSTLIGAVFDSNNNLIVGNAAASSQLLVWPAPYTGAPAVSTTPQATTAYRKLAIIGNQLFASSVAGATGRIDVYTLPLTNASVPAFAITTGVNIPEGLASDAAGNLYVGNLSNATVGVYAPPFSAASAPTNTITFTAPFAIFGIAVGP